MSFSRKAAAIMLLFVLVLAFTACGSPEDPANPADPAGGSDNTPAGFVKVTGATVTGSDSFDKWVNIYSSWKLGVFHSGRTVTISDFYIAKTEVTKELYKSVMGNSEYNTLGLTEDPSFTTLGHEYGEDSPSKPVENVSWYDAVYFCNCLSAKDGLTPAYTITDPVVQDVPYRIYGNDSSVRSITSATVTWNRNADGYRLPTEAEWEYAARGGDPAAKAWKYEYSGQYGSSDSTDSAKKLNYVAWYSGNSEYGGDKIVRAVSGKASNTLGLSDMSGNVSEWCYDYYQDDVPDGTFTDPVCEQQEHALKRVIRGGSYNDGPDNCGVRSRSYGGHWGYPNNNPTIYSTNSCKIGFRLVRNCPN